MNKIFIVFILIWLMFTVFTTMRLIHLEKETKKIKTAIIYLLSK